MHMWHDFRYALRRLGRDWKFTLTVTAILALCIGANSTMFSIFHSVLLQPLPFPEPDRLMQVVTYFQVDEGDGLQEAQNGAVWRAIRDETPSLDATVFSDWTSGVNFVRDGVGRYVSQQRVSAGFFRVLGVAPLMGREFAAGEDRAGGPAATILSHQVWERDFGSDPNIIGSTVFLRGEAPSGCRRHAEGFPVVGRRRSMDTDPAFSDRRGWREQLRHRGAPPRRHFGGPRPG